MVKVKAITKENGYTDEHGSQYTSIKYLLGIQC